MKMPLDASYVSDELTVRFYTCPSCGFDHVPFGASAWTDAPEDRMPEHDARYCPGCAAPIEWTA